MPANPSLTELKLKNLPVPEKGQHITWDAIKGFGIRVSHNGNRTFLLKHKNQFITLGQYPVLSLSDARTEARRIKAEFTLGRLRPLAMAYSEAVDAFLEERKPHLRLNSIRSYTRHLKAFHFHTKLAELTQHDLARQLKPLANRPAEHNQSVETWIIFFNWCIKRQYCTINPAIHLPQFPTRSRERVLNNLELKAVWTAAGQIGGNFGTLTKLLILMGQRVTETASIQTSWINCDLSRGKVEDGAPTFDTPRQCTITFPKEITKNKKDHTIPLGSLSGEILATQLRQVSDTKTNSALLFSARGNPTQPYTGFTHQPAILRKLSGVKNWVLHDLRRTFATTMAELGTAPHVLERLLNHTGGQVSGVAAIYNRATYLPEMRTAIEKYELHLKKVLDLS